MRIQGVQVEGHNPIVESRLRFLDECTCVGVILLTQLLHRDDDVLLLQVVEDDSVPHAHLLEYVFDITLVVIGKRERKFKQLA